MQSLERGESEGPCPQGTCSLRGVAGRALCTGKMCVQPHYLEAMLSPASPRCSESQYLQKQNEKTGRRDVKGIHQMQGTSAPSWEPDFVIISLRRSHRGGEVAEQEDDEILGQLCSDGVSTPRGLPQPALEDEKLTAPPPRPRFCSPRNPNGAGLPLWPAYDQKEHYLQLDLNLSVGQGLRAQKVEFWTETFPLVMATSEGGRLGPLFSVIFLSLLLPFFASFSHGGGISV